MDDPFFSIIVPAYNVDEYIDECIESIIKQSYNNLEIICVNDGSIDCTASILNDYQKHDRRLTVINQTNKGTSSARNKGIDIAKGRYIWFIDADDYIEPHACERLYQVVQQQNPDIIIFGAHISTSHQSPPHSSWLEKTLTTRNKCYYAFTPEVLFTEPGCRPFACRNCYKLSFLNQHRLRFEKKIRFGEDQVFQFMVFPRASHFAFIEDKLYHYRWLRNGSLMSTYKDMPEEKFKQHLRMAQFIRNRWEKSGDLKRMPADFFKWSIDFLGPTLIAAPFSSKRMYAQKLVQIWRGFNFGACRNSLSRKQVEVLNKIILLNRKPFGFPLRKWAIPGIAAKSFLYLKKHGFKHTMRLVVKQLKSSMSVFI